MSGETAGIVGLWWQKRQKRSCTPPPPPPPPSHLRGEEPTRTPRRDAAHSHKYGDGHSARLRLTAAADAVQLLHSRRPAAGRHLRVSRISRRTVGDQNRSWIPPKKGAGVGCGLRALLHMSSAGKDRERGVVTAHLALLEGDGFNGVKKDALVCVDGGGVHGQQRHGRQGCHF